MTTRVGLTGGVASGKSTVASMLRELGAVVIDADVLAREVVEPGTPGLAAVVAELGPDVLREDGSLDRPAVGRLVFADADARRRLEQVVHPLVYERIVELEAQVAPEAVVVHDIPLLTENGRQDDFDCVVVVDAPEELQLQRMVDDRGWTPAEAQGRIDAQASRAQRLAVATYVIENTGTREDLHDRVVEVFEAVRPAPGPGGSGS